MGGRGGGLIVQREGRGGSTFYVSESIKSKHDQRCTGAVGTWRSFFISLDLQSPRLFAPKPDSESCLIASS